ncbi:MAG: hypothetical protein R3C14_52165 [Caldilineaceae bacterium]
MEKRTSAFITTNNQAQRISRGLFKIKNALNIDHVDMHNAHLFPQKE